MTRHGLPQSSHAATPPLRRMRQYARFAKISATALNMSRGQLPIRTRSAGQKISLTRSLPADPQCRAGFAVTSTKQNFKSP